MSNDSHDPRCEFEKEDPLLWDLLGVDEKPQQPSDDFVARTVAMVHQAPARRHPWPWVAAAAAAGLLMAWGLNVFDGDRPTPESMPSKTDPVAQNAVVDPYVVDDLVARLKSLSASAEESSGWKDVEQVNDEFFGG